MRAPAQACSCSVRSDAPTVPLSLLSDLSVYARDRAFSVRGGRRVKGWRSGRGPLSEGVRPNSRPDLARRRRETGARLPGSTKEKWTSTGLPAATGSHLFNPSPCSCLPSSICGPIGPWLSARCKTKGLIAAVSRKRGCLIIQLEFMKGEEMIELAFANEQKRRYVRLGVDAGPIKNGYRGEP